VFNHLEIKVLVHNTTQIQGGTDIQNVVVPIEIMGFEVTPYSVPFDKTCSPDMYDPHNMQVVWEN
jgi:hypothetical protein